MNLFRKLSNSEKFFVYFTLCIYIGILVAGTPNFFLMLTFMILWIPLSYFVYSAMEIN